MATEQRRTEAKQGQVQGQAQTLEQRREKPDPHKVQIRFLLASKGKSIELLFTHGGRLECTLLAADQFTLLVRLADGQQMLIYKSGLAGIVRRESAGEGGGNDQ